MNKWIDWLIEWGLTPYRQYCNHWRAHVLKTIGIRNHLSQYQKVTPLLNFPEFSVTFPERDNADVDVWLKSAANTGFHDPNNLIIEFLCHWKLLKVREFSKWDEFPISDSNQLHRFCCEFYSDHWGHCEEKNSREMIKIYK